MTVYTQYFRIHRMQRNLESLKLNSKGVHAAALEELSTRDPIHKAKKWMAGKLGLLQAKKTHNGLY